MFLVFLGPLPLNAVFALLGPITYRGLSLVERGLTGIARFRRPLRPLRRGTTSSTVVAWLIFFLQCLLWLFGRMSNLLACILMPITNRIRAQTASAPEDAGRQRRPHTAPNRSGGGGAGQREQPRGEGEASVGAVHKLPLEIFRTEDELRALHSGELKQLLIEARKLAERCRPKTQQGRRGAPGASSSGRPGTAAHGRAGAGFGGGGASGGSAWGGAGAKAPIPLERQEIIKELLELRGGSSGAQCAVCLCAYESGDPLRVLPCGHRFHVECIDSWLMRRSAACPFCSVRVD